jgi:hypothetical protein
MARRPRSFVSSRRRRGKATPAASGTLAQGLVHAPDAICSVWARLAARRTLGTGSLRAPATSVTRSPTPCLASTLSAISRTRHASSPSASRISLVAASYQIPRSPRAPYARSQYVSSWAAPSRPRLKDSRVEGDALPPNVEYLVCRGQSNRMERLRKSAGRVESDPARTHTHTLPPPRSPPRQRHVILAASCVADSRNGFSENRGSRRGQTTPSG